MLRTDGQRENRIPTTNKVCGGIIIIFYMNFDHNWPSNIGGILL